MSKLIVEVCRVTDVDRHPNADRLDIVTVKGWKCVVGRHEFEVGDSCVYVPIDSILTDDLEFAIFSSSKIKLNKHRVRTIKLRGYVSQGLVIKLPTLSLEPSTPVGSDVADLLGITKWEPPTKKLRSNNSNTMQCSKRDGNPYFKKYTNMNHLNNFPYDLSGHNVEITEKIHGTNFRAGWVPANRTKWYQRFLRWIGFYNDCWEFVYGSHNMQLQRPEDSTWFKTNVYWETVVKYNLKQIIPKGIVLYGETYGPGIQKGYGYGLPGGKTRCTFYDILSTTHGVEPWWFSTEQKNVTFSKLKVPTVSVLYRGSFDKAPLQQLSSGPSFLHPGQEHIEGVVVTSTEPESRIVLKLLNPDYLLIKNNTGYH